MPAEAAHELGRRGTLAAIDLLWHVLGGAIALPFNAYDHSEKLTFDGSQYGIGNFNFDLLGHLQRPSSDSVTGKETVEVFVEVKNYTSGNSLLGEYESFSSEPPSRHLCHNTRRVFSSFSRMCRSGPKKA